MKKYLITLLTTGILLGAVSAQTTISTLVRFNLNDGNNDLNRDEIRADMDATATSSAVIEDATNDVLTWDSGRRVSGIGNASFSDSINFFAFTATAGTGLVFDLSGTGSFAEIRTDRVFGDSYAIEAVIWEGTDRTGTELFRGAIALTTADGNKQFGPIATIAGASTNISEIYVQFNYRSTNTAIRFQDVELVGDLTAVPEPSTYALALGFLALGGVMLRRRLRS